MSYANGTTNYNLPQTVGTDKRDWSDTNQAFSDVDAALKAASDGASQAAEDITALTLRVGTAEDDIAGLKAEDISLDGRLDTAEGAISTLQLQVPDVRGDLEDMIVAFNEASATSTHAYAIGDYFIYNDVLYKATAAIAIGDTIVPNTNCSATNVMTEVVNGAAAPTAADVSLAPITGMTADDVQEGIAELKSDLDNKADKTTETRSLLVAIPNAQTFDSTALDSGKKISDYDFIGFTVLDGGGVVSLATFVPVAFFKGFTSYTDNRFMQGIAGGTENLIACYVDDTHIIVRSSAASTQVNVFGINIEI